MKNYFNRYALIMASTSIFAAFSATAANSFYAPGDLVLFFQQKGGTNTVYANLGNAATLYRGSAAGASAAEGNTLTKTNILNLNSTLSSAFGATWATDATIYAGLAGVYSTNTTTNALTNLDPARTLYISSVRNSVGTVGIADSTGWDLTLAGDTAMDSAATGIQQQNNVLENSYTTGVTVSLTSISQIDDQNPLISVAGPPAVTIQGNAFMDTLEGGVQQQGSASVFGDFGGVVGNAEFALDLYRVLAKNTISGQVAGGLREGSFEGTVVVGSNGMVSYLVPEPSSMALLGLGAGALVLRRRRSA